MIDTAAILLEFAEREARGHSPLYERLAHAAAADPSIHRLLDAAPEPQRRATLLFAALHLLALRDIEPFPPDARALAHVCRRRRDALVHLLRTRQTQTNEPARSAQLLPAVSLAARSRPVAILEVGASAGLNLLLDRYRSVLGDRSLGPERSPVVLAPTISGVPLPAVSMPAVTARLGIDLAPIDLTQADDRDWLRACVWADQTDRLQRLDRAIEVALADPPVVRRADARTDLLRIAGAFAPGERLVVIHSNTLAYLDPDGRRRMVDQLDALGRRRDLAWVSAEGPGVLPDVFPDRAPTRPDGAWGLLGLATWDAGRRRAHTLARVGPHGSWLEWL